MICVGLDLHVLLVEKRPDRQSTPAIKVVKASPSLLSWLRWSPSVSPFRSEMSAESIGGFFFRSEFATSIKWSSTLKNVKKKTCPSGFQHTVHGMDRWYLGSERPWAK